MKKVKSIKRRLIKTGIWVLGSLISLLGFTGCPVALLYGVPYTEFRLRGTVTDSTDNHKVPGVQVRLLDGTKALAVTYTDANGYYLLTISKSSTGPLFRSVDYIDIDGAANGSYLSGAQDVTLNEGDNVKDIAIDLAP